MVLVTHKWLGVFSVVLRCWNQSDFNLVFSSSSKLPPPETFWSDWVTEKNILYRKKNLIIVPVIFYLLM